MDIISTFIMIIGVLAILVAIIMFIVCMKKNPKKIPLIIFVTGLALLIIGCLIQPSPLAPNNAETQETTSANDVGDLIQPALSTTNNTETQETTSVNEAAAIIKNSILQYPSSNENFKYNIYDKYIEITEYIGSQNVTSITVPAIIDNLPVYVVDISVFDKCEVANIIFEEGIYDINSGFSSSLKSVTLPSTLNYINYGMFKNCFGLENIVIPEGIDIISSNAFECCTSLIEITIPSTVKTISSALFAYCHNLERINLPNGIKYIDKDAFIGCKNLKSLTIPDTVEKIGINAFEGTGLTSIEIPASVTQIGGHAFWNCDSLTEVKFYNSDLSIEPTDHYINEVAKNLFGTLGNTSLVVYGKPGSTIAQVCADENILFQPF